MPRLLHHISARYLNPFINVNFVKPKTLYCGRSKGA